MSFHDTRLPERFSKGSLFGTGFKTKLVQLRAGVGRATQFWPNGRRRFQLERGVDSLDSLIELYEFYLARQGAANTFRVKDWLDHATNSTGVTFRDSDPEVSETDELLVQITSTTYQMVKRYTSGPTTQVRNLTHLVAGTVKISEDDSEILSGFGVDLLTGVVTFNSAPSGVIKGGCEYDVHCRFGEDADEFFAAAIDAIDTGNLPTITVEEELGTAAYNHQIDYGGAKDLGAVNSNVTLSEADPRLITLAPGTASLEITLPNAGLIPQGGPWFVLVNEGTETMTIKSSTGVTVTSSFDPGDVAELWLGEFSGSLTWYVL